ncbi:MAG: AhpC/TSA family protein [Bacteroidales bacterium]|nr:AhpC/TSA family protein [Bacteroidales bacterium]
MKNKCITQFLPVLFITLLLVSCSDRKSVRLKGESPENKDENIILSRIDIDIAIPLDSARVKKDGRFSFTFKADLPEFYQIGNQTKGYTTFIAAPGDKIQINYRTGYFDREYSVSGSPETSKMILLDSALAETKRKIDSLRLEYDKAYSLQGFPEKEKELNDSFVKLLKDQRMFNIAFILKNLGSLASIKALYQKVDDQTYVLYDSRDLQFFKLVSDTLNHLYPKSRQARALKIYFENEMKKMRIDQFGKLLENAPEKVLDPNLKNTEGRRIALSSLKGKFVLLTFWSAASADCIKENLELKNYYSKYRDKGFEIYQVNLDLNEETWKKAVQFDELPWINVREDDPAKPEFARLYNVTILPANFLYSREGEIIAVNLHGKSLQLKLRQIFGY